MVIAQMCSARLASGCTRWCNCGESPPRSVQENAAKTTAARRAVRNYVNVRIVHRAWSLRQRSGLRKQFCRPCSRSPRTTMQLICDCQFGRQRDHCLRVLRRCPCSDHFRVFSIFGVSVLIRGDQIPTEMSKVTPAVENHPATKRLSFAVTTRQLFSIHVPACASPSEVRVS